MSLSEIGTYVKAVEGSNIVIAFGTDESGVRVEFGADARAMEGLLAALETNPGMVALVETWAILSVGDEAEAKEAELKAALEAAAKAEKKTPRRRGTVRGGHAYLPRDEE